MSYFKSLDCEPESGAGTLEYSLIFVLLLAALVTLVALLEPGSQQFHDDMTPGLDVSYPEGYLTPTPTATAQAL